MLSIKVRKSQNDFFEPTFSPKNERMNSTLLLWNLRLTCFRSFFGENWWTQKRHFEINWPLAVVANLFKPSNLISGFSPITQYGYPRAPCYHKLFLKLPHFSTLWKTCFKNVTSEIFSFDCAYCSHLSKHTAWVIKNLNLIFLKTSGPNPGRQLMAYLIILKYIWTCKQVILSNFQMLRL